MKLKIEIKKYPLKTPFIITRRTYYDIQMITVTLIDGNIIAKGEATGVDYHGETPENLREQIETVRYDIEQGISREELQTLLPLGGARNAVDCALWDLEAKKSGGRIWNMLMRTRFRLLQLVPVPVLWGLNSAWNLTSSSAKANSRVIQSVERPLCLGVPHLR